MAGVLVSSIGSGQLITRYGRYKVFPIVGTALMVVGLLLLSRLERRRRAWWSPTSTCWSSGSGSASSCRCSCSPSRTPSTTRTSGVATSTATLFRSMGGAIGVPLFGAIFANQLSSHLLGEASAADAAASLPAHLGPQQIDALPAAIRDPYVAAYAESLKPVFLIAGVIAARRVPRHVAVGGAPAAQDGRRPGARRQLRRAARPDVDGRAGGAAQLARTQGEPPRRLRTAGGRGRARPRRARDLAPASARRATRATRRRLAEELAAPARRPAPPLARRGGPARADTGRPRGRRSRIAEVRCGEIRRLLDGWEPDEHPAVLALIQRFGRIFSKAPPAPAPVAG